MLIPATIFSIKKKIFGLPFPFKIVLWLVMLLLLEQNFLYSFEESLFHWKQVGSAGSYLHSLGKSSIQRGTGYHRKTVSAGCILKHQDTEKKRVKVL